VVFYIPSGSYLNNYVIELSVTLLFYFQLIFDTNMLPVCMFNEDFKVFGIHVYLRNSSRLLCTRDLSSLPRSRNDHVDENQGTIQILLHDNIYNTSIRDTDASADINDGHKSRDTLASSSCRLMVTKVFQVQHCCLQLIPCAVLLFIGLQR